VTAPPGAEVEHPIARADPQAVEADGQHETGSGDTDTRWCSMVQR
jgi:hypothetical protein